jgi:hypothetical protein
VFPTGVSTVFFFVIDAARPLSSAVRLCLSGESLNVFEGYTSSDKTRHSLKSENNCPVRRSLTALDSGRAAGNDSRFLASGAGCNFLSNEETVNV